MEILGLQSIEGFIASDNDFFDIRRFGTLNARVILALQDQLSQLEENLNVLDANSSQLDCEDLNNGSFRDDPQADRRKLIGDAKAALLEYIQYVVTARFRIFQSTRFLAMVLNLVKINSY